MRFKGYTKIGYIDTKELDQPPFQPIFEENERVLVLDMEELIRMQVPGIVRGVIKGFDGYKLRFQAKRAVRQVRKEVDRLVIWSTNPSVFTELQYNPFTKVDLRISGGTPEEMNGMIKNLNYFSSNPNLRNVVALEDYDTYFRPLDRVVRVGKHENLNVAFT